MFPALSGGVWQRRGLCRTFLSFSASTFNMFSSGAANMFITKSYLIELQHNQVVFRGTDIRGDDYLCNEYSEHDGLGKLCNTVKKDAKEMILLKNSLKNHCCSVELTFVPMIAVHVPSIVQYASMYVVCVSVCESENPCNFFVCLIPNLTSKKR